MLLIRAAGALPSPFSIQTGITEQDLDVYRAPYPDPASRRPLLQWPREIPLDREPEQAPGLGGGQRDHAQVGGCRLIGPDRWWRAGAGAVFQEGQFAAVITRSGL
jgi:hypothetical protein